MNNAKIHELLVSATKKEASDIHLVVHKPPIFRIHGELTATEMPVLTAKDLKDMLVEIMSNRQKQIFNDTKELDFAYYCMDDFQFRVNVHVEKGNIAATIRLISTNIPDAKILGLPPAIDIMARKRKGLIILSGTAGSGKSTTLNYMIHIINKERRCKIITIEDPIELVHKSDKSLIIQREVGSDTNSFASALKFSLRQDPDVVVIGEIRDLESIGMALTTAETGHLVITTLHAPDAIETINRIIDVYPSGQRDQICTQLAENLVGVVGQMLIAGKDGERRVLTTEVLMATMPIRNMIRRSALVELRGQLDSEENKYMHTFESHLTTLVRDGLITLDTAKEYARDPRQIRVAV